MRVRFGIVCMFVAVLLVGASAQASTILVANLSNGAENPPTNPTLTTGAPRPASFGTATFILADDFSAMSFTATIFNIDVTGSQTADTNDNLGNAHIHAGPAVTPTTNGPVVWGFFGSPFNDNNPNDAVVTPFTTGVGGTFSGKWDAPEGNGGTNLALQVANILAGRSYINFHTSQFAGGEIRGNIVAVAVTTPEPGTLVLFGLGGAMLRLRRRFTR